MRLKELLSVGQAADQLDVSPSTVRNWVEKGYIHAFRLPSGVRRIPQEEITRLVQDYFRFAPAIEGEDEGTLVLAPEEESGVWGAAVNLGPEDSSDRSDSAETAQDRASAQ
jgi:excisionase family DNA binding protein